jgi:murein DD-endopeptidase MepM/ murein hydrolase activator NlpD
MMRKRLLPPIVILLMLALSASLTAAPDAALAQSSESTPLPDPYAAGLPDATTTPESGWLPAPYPVPWSIAPHDHFYFNKPIGAEQADSLVASYRYGGVFFAPDQPHTGVDFKVDEGTPVLAAASGQVIWAGYGLLFGYEDETDPYGLAVAIEHDFGYNNQRLYTLYAHLSEISVVKGQQVETGETLGLSGETGFTTAPHLHFEVRLGNNNFYQTYNPELWIVPPQGWGVLVGKVTNNIGELLIDHEVHLRNVETDKEYYTTTYAHDLTINPDPYFQENYVISDLPAGEYEITITFELYYYRTTVTIYPGTTTYFRYRGHWGFEDVTPAIHAPDNLPPEAETQP